MPMFTNPFRRSPYVEKENTAKNPLIQYFDGLLTQENSPFDLATDDLQEILQAVESESALLSRLTSECIQASLLASIDEKFLSEVKAMGQQEAITKCQQYTLEVNSRSQLTAQHSTLHMGYIMNYAYCEGCAVCEYHEDVKALVEPFEEKNLDFFIHLYVGMKTINYTFLAVVGNLLKAHPEHKDVLKAETIWGLRQHVYQKAEGLYRQLIA